MTAIFDDPEFGPTFAQNVWRLLQEGDVSKVQKARHSSADKPRRNTMPPCAADAYDAVRQYGEAKYGNDLNWTLGTEWMEFAESARRHLDGWIWNGDFDAESGLNELSHALWNIVTLIYYQRHALGTDDRMAKRIEKYRR